MTKHTDIDIVTMRAIGFEPDGEGGWKKISKTPARPGKAVRKALIDHGYVFQAAKEAKDDSK